ncbi:MAG: hypothetical protein HY043_21630 [Verrucomicrobia bacterium]|nr:hypothetical protein [Verrucomicrobiota bacterium]
MPTTTTLLINVASAPGEMNALLCPPYCTPAPKKWRLTTASAAGLTQTEFDPNELQQDAVRQLVQKWVTQMVKSALDKHLLAALQAAGENYDTWVIPVDSPTADLIDDALTRRVTSEGMQSS